MSDLSAFPPAVTLDAILIPGGQLGSGNVLSPVSLTPKQIASLSPSPVSGQIQTIEGVLSLAIAQSDGSTIAISLAPLFAALGSVIAPSPPQNIVISSEAATSITLAWGAPATGFAPIFYSVGYRIAGTNAFIPAATLLTTTTATINGLAPNVAYDFQVAAINFAGSTVTKLLNILTTAVQGPDNGPVELPDGSTLTLG